MNYILSIPLPVSERALGMTAVLLIHLLAGIGLMSLAQPVLLMAKPLRIDLIAADPAPAGPPDLPIEAPRPLPVQREQPRQRPALVPPPKPVTEIPPVIQAPPAPVSAEAPVFSAPPPPVEPVVAVTDAGASGGGAAGAAAGGRDGGSGSSGSGTAEQGARYDVDYLSNPKPQYPMASRKMGEEGTVMLRVQVSEAGRPLQVLVAQSSGYARLDRAARETVAGSWSFLPGRRGDHAVTSWVMVPIEFSLSR